MKTSHIPLRSIYLAICTIVFLTGLTTYSVKSYQQSQSSQQLQEETPEPARAYVLTSLVAKVDANRIKTITAIHVQEVDAEGNWVVKRTFIGRAGEIRTEVSGQNYTRTDLRGNQITGTVPQAKDTEMFRKMRSETFLKNHPKLLGTETIAGLVAYRIKSLDEDGRWVEQAFSPRTGYIPLRLIDHSADGTEIVIEAVKIEFK
ncbi:MAG: hypothetical protein LH647_06045 [Leptolyngbyaceae cyanobacterium CAN_BIN12]|nr:hypothetical protein [Leptolyngbyaceae cyanobacterium CAN_BIN12]